MGKAKKDQLGIADSVEFVHRDKDGKVVRRWSNKDVSKLRKLWNKITRKHNSMTDDGFAQVAAFLLKDIDADHSVYKNYDYMGIGIGDTAADPTDHQLETQKGVRQATTGTRVTTGGITNNTAQWVATFSHAIDATLTGTDAITEVGIFYDDEDDHTMLLRIVFAAENMQWDSGDSIEMTVKCQMKQGA